ncbi:hypothetical protein Pcinc_003854 [Petrolisthes cinctipes]|uniref:MADF domain-containing protein n=1 Tax=Petrolisthes cinctipes TaxID=88211 RepID=A0AAE1GMK0_PETCI|nr:hypothetical protein Pcinc_003854 [Petrolisthes cinctipes]
MSQVRCRFESHHTRSVIPKRPKIKSKEYSDREAKAAAYSVLIEKLKQKDTSANRETVTKKINAMRSSFRKEVKKVTASRRSGAAADDIYQPRLWYYNLLLFLQDQEVGRDSVTNVNEATAHTPNNSNSFSPRGEAMSSSPHCLCRTDV